MIRNTASQVVGAQMVSATDGSAFTGTVSVVVTKDGGTQGAGGGTVTHEGNGFHSYTPTQAETDAAHVAFTFTGTGAVPQTVQVYTRAATPDVNVAQISGDSAAADNLEAASDGTGFNLGGGSVVAASVTGAVGSVTGNVGGNVTGSVGSVASGGLTAASFAADSITAAKLAADVTTELQAGLATAAALTTVEGKVDTIDTNVDTLLTRITSTLFAGITSLAEWLGLLAGKQTGDATARTEVRATGAGSGTFDETADSLEAVRDRGDAAWITATGFSTLDAAGVRTAVGLASANLDTQLGDLPTNAELATSQAAADDATLAAIAALNNLSAAQVNAEVDTALADIHLDHLLAVTYDPASKPGAADALLNELIESDAGVARYTANALEQGPGGGSAPTAADIADAVWEEAIADHSGTAGSTAEALNAAGSAGDPWVTALPGAYGAGSAGKIVGDNLNATVSSRATQTSVDTIDGIVDAILVDTATIGTPAGVSVSADIAAVKVDTAAILVDTGTTLQGELDGIQADTEDIQSKIGTPAGVSVSADIAAVKAETASILTDTAEIGTAGAGLTAVPWNASWDAEVQSEAADALVAYDPPTKAELDAAVAPLATAVNLATVDTVVDQIILDIAALNNLSAAQVNAEIVDALATDTYAEPGAVPAASATLAAKIGWLAALARNKVTQSTTTQTLRNDADNADVATATVSDDGTTFTRAEWT